jgi:hypothetical protein
MFVGRGTMAAKAGEIEETVRQSLPAIKAWQAEGVALREMSRRLGVSDSSFRGALKRVEAEAHTEVHLDRPSRVYEGISPAQPEAIRVVMEEARGLLPTLREMVGEWSVLQSMIREWTQRQQLLEVAPTYQPYDGFYSCRLNHRLIRDLRAYADENRLSQSELVTLALQVYMGQQK